MTKAMLEHVNVTVSDPMKTAEMLCELFDWHIRWEGAAKLDGHTIHVGTDEAYVAVYSYDKTVPAAISTYETQGSLNHIGVVVEDLDKVEDRVRKAGFKPHSHADYEPGRRFYFDDHDGIEFEVVSYAQAD